MPDSYYQALDLADRRADLCKVIAYCPNCRGQLQLIDWFRCPAQWKCRECKVRFSIEPNE